MTRRSIEELQNSPHKQDTIMSPPPAEASPVSRSPLNGEAIGVRSSPPGMLTAMTPVNVIDVKKEHDRRTSEDHVYQVKTEMIYPEKEESELYHSISEKHDAQIDLIYEDGNKTVIYTTGPDQKGLEMYSTGGSDGDITINNINGHLDGHATHLADVLMSGGEPGDAGQIGPDGSQQAGPAGTVSVVLPTGGQGILQYSQAQVPATTVLVLSELVEDMSSGVPVIGLRKRKANVEEQSLSETASGATTSHEGGGVVVSPRSGGRMADLNGGGGGSGASGDGGGISDGGGGPDDGPPTSGTTSIVTGGGNATGAPVPPHDQQSWRAYYEHPLTAATTAMLNISSGGSPEDQAATMGFIYEYYKLPPIQQDATHVKDKIQDIWPASSQTGSILTSQLKSTNGLVSGAGLELATPAGITAAQLSTAQDIGLFINQHVGYAQPITASGQNLQIVKREPEDLSHHRRIDSNSPDLDSGGIIIEARQRPKVVLVSANGQETGELVVDVNGSSHGLIKDESHHRGLNSPQHGSRSMNGTPTSSHSSLLADGSNAGPIELITADLKPAMYTTQIFAPMPANHGNTSESPSPIPYPEHGGQYAQTLTGAYGSSRSTAPAFAISDPYYREYFTVTGASGSASGGAATPEPMYTSQVRQNQLGQYVDSPENNAGSAVSTANFVERYVRQSSAYHTSKGVIAAATAAGLTVDLPSPDSGIGADAITPRDQNTLQQSFDYTELCGANAGLLDPSQLGTGQRVSGSQGSTTPGGRTRPWHDFGRQNDADKIQIPKIFSPVGFKYNLETPISTSQRREDDRITYINKGQFYGISLEYIPDPDKPLKSQTVKSVVMLMFREEKSPEDEIKAWQFWHGRQHSVKQRILDADTKNSVGLVGCIEEVAHNAIAVYWNPLDSSAKINIAVQCLSTDFSSQKGVKGLPLHLQIDTYEDPRDTQLFHRGYCQIKVFCDKGAERKTRDEERRAAKRKMTATGRKKLDELYHPVSERSEFYSMSDLAKPPVLFSPAEDIDKLTSMELQGFYNHDDSQSLSSGQNDGGHLKSSPSPFLLHPATKPPITPTLKFHNHFPQEADKKDGILDNSLTADSVFSPPLKRPKLAPPNPNHPPLNERVMLYVRQENEDVYTPLHVVPPTTAGLLNAIEHKYKIDSSRVNCLFRKNRKGILAKIDDEMVTYYCNEDLFLLEVKTVGVDEDLYDITFIEIPSH